MDKDQICLGAAGFEPKISIMEISINRVRLMLILALMSIACFPQRDWSFAVPAAAPLADSLSDAQVIVLAKLIKYVPDPEDPKLKEQLRRGGVLTPQLYISLDSVMGPGSYSLQVIRTIKGHCASNLQLKLPTVLGSNYPLLKPPGQDARLILLLKRDGKQGWTPVDSNLPFIQILEDTVPANRKVKRSPQSTVIDLILRCLPDTALRKASTYILRTVVDPQIPKTFVHYLDDPNAEVQNNVLYGLLVNQQIKDDEISRVVKLVARQEVKHGSTDALFALEALKNPESVPLLNPLLFESDMYVRMAASFALRDLADRTSIPYLMLALQDPDPQRVVPYVAYATLHRLNPKLGRENDMPYFEKHKSRELQTLYNWWRDELLGRHALKQPPTVSRPVLSHRQLSLFNPAVSKRHEAINRLRKVADKSTVPYLVLALRDPDIDVAYNACVILHRLLGDVGTGGSRVNFQVNRATQTRPLYDWWKDELLGTHVAKAVSAWQALPNPGLWG